jgi:predicted regulator of Ras-like GTPase activity (Roadblock/LC7/MglB family)
METILQAILDVSGVSAALVFEGAGQLVCHRGHAVYDRDLCEQLSRTLAKAIDTVQLQQEDWESISAQYADGKLLLRDLGSSRVLAVVADATLNASFATVAIRVAANKLKKASSPGASGMLSTSAPLAATSHPVGAPPHPAAASAHSAVSAHPISSDSRPVLANSGLSWSQSISSAGLSRIPVGDPASGSYLTRCSKELARAVGPMAKVYVAEGVRRVCPDAAFTLASAAKLIEDLAAQIEDADDRKQFQKSMEKA